MNIEERKNLQTWIEVWDIIFFFEENWINKFIREKYYVDSIEARNEF